MTLRLVVSNKKVARRRRWSLADWIVVLYCAGAVAWSIVRIWRAL